MEKRIAKYDRILFGMALARMGMDAASTVDFIDSKKLNAIELPFDCFELEDKEFRKRFRIRPFDAVIWGGLMDEALSARIPFEDEKYRRQYTDELRSHIELIGRQKFTCAKLNFDMQSVLADPDASACALEIIRALLPTLAEYDMTLLLPVCLPALHQLPLGPSLMAKFLRDTMWPQIKVSAELNFPEISAFPDLNALCGPLVWELRQLIFTYNADSGCHLPIETMRSYIDAAAKYRFRGPFMIAPESSHNRMAIAEYDSLCKMVAQLRNE